MASSNERELINEEIISLKRALDKHDKDYLIVTGMITNLMDDRIGISEERIRLIGMINDRELKLVAMDQL